MQDSGLLYEHAVRTKLPWDCPRGGGRALGAQGRKRCGQVLRERPVCRKKAVVALGDTELRSFLPRRRVQSQASEHATSRDFFSFRCGHKGKKPEDLGRRKEDPMQGPGDSSFLPLRMQTVCSRIQDLPLGHRNNTP